MGATQKPPDDAVQRLFGESRRESWSSLTQRSLWPTCAFRPGIGWSHSLGGGVVSTASVSTTGTGSVSSGPLKDQAGSKL
jgi:hypothetical protein